MELTMRDYLCKMRISCWALSLSLFVSLLVTSCDKKDGQESNSISSKEFQQTISPNADRGKEIYRANCFICHGVDPAHEGPLGPAIQNSSKELVTIRLKKGGRHYPKGYKPKRETATMPAQAHLLSEIDHLMAYINLEHRPKALTKASTLKADASKGKATYDSTCAGCHQKDGKGKAGFAPSITDQDFLSIVSDDFIKQTIKKGRTGTNMISFSFLQDNQINEIIAYLRSFQKNPKREYNHDWKATGDLTRGKKLFNGACAQCHGANGKGYVMGGSGPAVGLNGFLSVADDGYIEQVLLSGREGTAMRSFDGSLGLAHLDKQGMSDIIIYLRYLGKINK